MIRGLVLVSALVCAVQAVAAQSVQPAIEPDTLVEPVVHLRGLDNLNGTTQDITLPVGETARYGHLEIAAETCRVPSDEPTSDAFAYLRIRDVREDSPRFSGWMFASSPALSALDHPRYDVWVLSCNSR